MLKGDIKPAIETHEMLYQVIQRHNFLPEAFTTDFQVGWEGAVFLHLKNIVFSFFLYDYIHDYRINKPVYAWYKEIQRNL